MYIKNHIKLIGAITVLLLFLSVFSNAQSPGGVSGATFWARADNGVTTSGSNVTAWTNLANTSNNLTVTASQPTLVSSANINFNPAVTFGGTAVAYTTGNVMPAGSSYSRFVAFKTSTTTDGNILGSGFPPSTLATFSLWKPTTANTLSHWAGSNFGNASATYTSGLPNVVSAIYAKGVLGTYININGTSNTATLNSPSFATGSNVAIGGAFNTTFQNIFNGVIPEAIIYPSALTATQVAHVESYLAIKYGSTLSTNYVASNNGGAVLTTWDRTTNSGYNNNIAGIGRDDNTALLQRQSQSQNSNDQVTISLGTIASTNATNTGIFTADRQFLIWGDDAGSLTIGTATGRGTYGQRFARVWKTQNTNGFAGNITVYFPVSTFGNIAAANVGLIYGNTAAELSNGAGRVIAQSGTTTINGINNYVFSVPSTQIASMQFFSFATNILLPGGVPGALIWFKADAGVTLNGSGVSAWANQVGTNTNFTQVVQSTPSAQPIYSPSLWNFNPNITYNASQALFNTTSLMADLVGATENDVFAAIRVNINAAVYFQVNDNGSTTSRFNLESNRINFLSGAATTFINSPANFNIPRILSASTTAVPSNQITTYINGKFGQLNTYTGTMSIGTPGQVRVYVGSFAGGLGLRGDYPELINYNRSLSATERLQVLSYLSLKYGLTLDQTVAQNYLASNGTTVAWDASTNSAYSNNIAGIGRDDLTGLNQKQAISINSGNQAVVSVGAIATANAGNTSTFTSDRQFFMWGDDNASLLPRTLTNKTLSPRRFARVWRTQNTNSFNQSINIYYPVSGFSNALPSSVALIYGTLATALSDGSGDLIVQSGTVTINGVNYYSFTVPVSEINKLQFFSFASNPSGPGGVVGHALWLKANDLSYSDGTAINATNLWTAYNGSSAGAILNGTAPTFKLNSWNFNPVVRFTAGGIGGDYGNTGTSITAITVLNATGSTVSNGGIAVRGLSIAGGSTDDDNSGMAALRGNTATNGLQVATNGNAVTSNFVSNVINGNNPGIAISMRTPATGFASGNLANRLMAQWNGNGLALTNGNNTSALPAYNVDYYVLGAYGWGGKSISPFGGFLAGDIPEVAIYSFDLSDTERIQVNSYLAIKYGVTLDQSSNGPNYLASDGTTVIWSRLANTTYQNNVAGIGRDDASVLNQKQSMSINTGNQLVVSLGTAQATNEANTNTFAADKRFLVWGDNAGSLAGVNDSAIPRPSGANLLKRLGRIWKIQNTNSFNQSITVYFPTATLTSAFGTASPYLIYDDQADFKGSVKQLVTSSGTQVINGNSYTAFTFTVPSTPANLFLTFSGYYIQSMVNPSITIGIQNGRIKY